MNSFAPVFIPTLNRYEHFKRCVESLSVCTHADKTDLYIAFDYPLNEYHWEGYEKIEKYLNEINGFKTVNLIKRNENFGARMNILEGRKTVFEKYDRMILSEDDNYFSPNFLDYINKGLDKFENDDNLFAICGHRPLIKMPKEYKYNYYFAKGFSAWGYGIWRDRSKNFVYNTKALVEFMQNKDYVNKLKTYNEQHYYSVLNYIKNNMPMYGDGAIGLDMIKYKKYCVYPSVAKVRNYGHDGSGVHCGYIKNSKYAKQEIDNNNEFEYSDSVPLFNEKIAESLRNYRKINAKQRAKIAIKNLLFKLNIEVRRINKT